MTPQQAQVFIQPEGPARWLTIHPRRGIAAFMCGGRDGIDVEWDISAVPADGGLLAVTAATDGSLEPRGLLRNNVL